MPPDPAPEGFELIDETPGYGAAFGPVWIDRASRKIGFRVGERHMNPGGVCHGGAVSTFADMQILAATGDEGAPRIHRPTISLSLDFLAPIQIGAWVEAEVTRLRVTRTLVFTQAVIAADGEIAARSNGIYRNYT